MCSQHWTWALTTRQSCWASHWKGMSLPFPLVSMWHILDLHPGLSDSKPLLLITTLYYSTFHLSPLPSLALLYILWGPHSLVAVSGLGAWFFAVSSFLDTEYKAKSTKPQAAMAPLIWSQRFRGCGKIFGTCNGTYELASF